MNPEEVVMGLETEYGLTAVTSSSRALTPGTISSLINELTAIDHRQYRNRIGARIYRDADLLEGATPECAGPNAPKILALYMKAMDALLLDRLVSLTAWTEDFLHAKPHLLKGSTDGKNGYYGGQLNLRIPKDVTAMELFKNLGPYLGTSCIWAGQGGIEKGGVITPPRFIFSPRILSIENAISGESRSSRPLICTKSFFGDSTHDLEGWKRLQLLSRDSLLSDFITYVDVGIISLLVRLIAKRGFPPSFPHFPEKTTPEERKSIVDDMHAINRDPTLTATVYLANCECLTALKLQKLYWEILGEAEAILELTPEDKIILQEFKEILNTLENDPILLSDRCECWMLKEWAEALLEKHNTTWGECPWVMVRRKNGKEIPLNQYLAQLAYQAAAVDEEWGLWPRLAARGTVKKLYTQDEVATAAKIPPPSRAAFRVAMFDLAERYQVTAVVKPIDSWASIYLTELDRTIKKYDPTDRDNSVLLQEVENLLQGYLSSRANS